jgi:Helicase associated domain/Helicase conserved C-terminal domain
MSASKREPILRAFADGDRTLISNARCLTEGVDVPAVDMVAFLSPKRSRIDIVQATGRAMRKNDVTQKMHGYVLLPLFLEERAGESLEAAVTRADFDEIWAVLQALQEHDEVLGETIAQIRAAREVAGGFDDQVFREKLELIAPEISLDTLRQSITTKLLDALISVRSTWDSMFQALLRFKRQHGHYNVLWRHDLDLAFWVIAQREAKQRGALSLDKVQRLAAIGFEWEPRDIEWEKMFELLVQFKQQHGHCNVLRTKANDRQLATWCDQQRKRRRRLSDDQVQRLEQLGFLWSRMAHLSARPVSEWEKMFEVLVQFKQQHGHCTVPREGAKDRELATWCERQRYHRLSDNQFKRLEAIGFQWKAYDAEWEANFESLVRFKQQEGHCNVPLKWPDDPRLGLWAENQRRSQRRGSLNMYSQRRLNEIGFEWDSWEAMFASLLQFKQQHGHCNVSFGDSKQPLLGTWVTKQRQDRRRRCLSEERVRRLDEIGFTWGKSLPPRTDVSMAISKVHSALDWEAMFDALVHFKQQYGHCNVPRNHTDDPELAKWVERQRVIIGLGGLSWEQRDKLELLGFK